MDQKIIGENLRRIREEKGWSQAQVADLAQISRVAYRNIENGTSTPKVSTLQNIANGVGVKLQDLIAPRRTLKKVRFRALNKMNSRDSILTEVARWLEDYKYLEDLLCNHIDFKLRNLAIQFSSMAPGENRAKYAAKAVRYELELGDNAPIRDIAGLLESCGIKLYRLSLVSNGFFGLSVSEEEGGPAIIVNVWDRISVERWIFSAAHELGHLLLHLSAYNIEESAEIKAQEDEANVFASYFLMPDVAFESEWEETYGLPFVDRVLKVKKIFQVSYKSVLYRKSDRIGNIWAKFQGAYKSKTGRGLGNTDEPEALSPDRFDQAPEFLRSREPDSLSPSHYVENRLYGLVRTAVEEDQITMSRAAEILRVDLKSMRELISSWV